MFPGSVIPPPRPPTNFIAPALRHQIVAAVVDTPMSCAAPYNGTPRHTWSNNLRRTALECGYPLGIATSKSTDVADWQRALFRNVRYSFGGSVPCLSAATGPICDS